MSVISTARVTELYAVQSHAIDEGRAAAWAATFTPDGSFSSPTFGDPVVGAEALTRFARDVFAELAAEGLRQRHWVNSVVVDPERQTSRAYLMIVRVGPEGVPSLVRHVVIEDRLASAPHGTVLVRARQVRPDP